MLVLIKSTLDFLWFGSIVILVHEQFEPKSGPNAIQNVRKIMFMLTDPFTLYCYFCICFLLSPHNTIMPVTIQSNVW